MNYSSHYNNLLLSPKKRSKYKVGTLLLHFGKKNKIYKTTKTANKLFTALRSTPAKTFVNTKI